MADFLSMLGSPIDTAKALWNGERLPGETDAEYQAKLDYANMMSARAQETQVANAQGLPMPTLQANMPILPESPVVPPLRDGRDPTYQPPVETEQPVDNTLGGLPLHKPTGAGGDPVQPVLPGMAPVQKLTDRERVEYAGTTEGDYNDAVKAMTTASNAVLNIKKKMYEKNGEEDSDFVKGLGKQAAAAIDVQQALDPEQAKVFFDKLRTIRDDIDTASKDLEKFQAEAKVDPNRYMKQMPMTDKIMNAFAIYMEGMAAAKAAGKGVAVPPMGAIESQLNRAMEQDIQFQREEMKSKQESKVNTINRYKDNLALTNNERVAEIKTKLDFLAATNASLEAIKNKFQGQVDVAAIDEMKANNLVKEKKAQLDLGKSIVKTNLTEKMIIPGGSALPRDKQAEMAFDRTKKFEEKTKEYQERFAKSDALIQNVNSVRNAMKEGKDVELAINKLKGMFVKEAQGGVGTISDSDMKAFGFSTSFVNNLKTWATEKFSGEVPETVLEQLERDAGNTRLNTAKVIAETAKDYREMGVTHGLAPDMAESIVPKSSRTIELFWDNHNAKQKKQLIK